MNTNVESNSKEYSIFESSLLFDEPPITLPFGYYARQHDLIEKLTLNPSINTIKTNKTQRSHKVTQPLLSNIEPKVSLDTQLKNGKDVDTNNTSFITSFVDLEWQSIIDSCTASSQWLKNQPLDSPMNNTPWLSSYLQTLSKANESITPIQSSKLEKLYSPLTFYQKQGQKSKVFEFSDTERELAKAWLHSISQKYIDTSTDSLFTVDSFYDIVLTTLRSSQNIESALFDLLGIDHWSLIQEIVSEPKFLQILNHKDFKLKLTLPSSSTSSFASTVPESLLTLGYHVHPEYPHVYMTQVCVPQFSSNWALPTGTTHVNEMEYEAFTLPACPKSPQHTKVPITSLPSWAQPVFPKYVSLNTIQSLVYPVVFQTNENMLVCAPTGAGKTDIALLGMLKTIHSYQDEPYKIIYVAPMKALASEMVSNFSQRLRCLNVHVKEWTGDIQLSHAQVQKVQVLVMTPEKWDSVTRKAVDFVDTVKLLLLDEVHLLHEDRGAVLESLVARTQRQVESSQSMIRIIGLSATLPNYLDVAAFLRVDPKIGLFYFDAGYRPVPLKQHFLGIKGKPGPLRKHTFHRLCYEQCRSLILQQHQVMVFVHSRSETFASAMALRDLASKENQVSLFLRDEFKQTKAFVMQAIQKSKNHQLKQVLALGMGVHHAGMARSDRHLVEKLFRQGSLSVLFCTATLAWGVNLPAHAVIIKETDVYDTLKGKFVDLGILDVLQIFGRAGRPQYETEGEAFILTTHEKLSHYISAITQQLPIESQFTTNLIDLLNAEIVLGTVTSISEGIQWLGYTYLYTRMLKNPRYYGIQVDPLDPLMIAKRRTLIEKAATKLFRFNMVNYHKPTGYLSPKEIGRIASHYYIQYTTMGMVQEALRPGMAEADVLVLLSQSSEFSQIQFKEKENQALEDLKPHCYCQIPTTLTENQEKVNTLIQAYISNHPLEEFISDSLLIAQNAARVLRALFELAIHHKFMDTAQAILALCQSLEHRRWSFLHPLVQFPFLPFELIQKLDRLEHLGLSELREMAPTDLSQLLHHSNWGSLVHSCAWKLPWLLIEVHVVPITSTIIDLRLTLTCDFQWDPRVHGGTQVWWYWIEDRQQGTIYHVQSLRISKKTHSEPHIVTLKLRLTDPCPSQLDLHYLSNTWFGVNDTISIVLDHVVFPKSHFLTDTQKMFTDLLDLQPLPITALHDAKLEALYAPKFQFLNPIQTQIFHTLYYTSENVLLGAPTGSGKTLAAELVMWQTFRLYPKSIVIYIAPMKALVRERVLDWRMKLNKVNRSIEEWTGDVTPDSFALRRCDVIVTTPEKWDGLSRGWRDRWFVQKVRCVIFDEIHLLGSERGPVLETLTARIRYLSQFAPIRVVGLSTALANPMDLATWLGVPHFYNFRHSVRPVPLEVFIEGFSGQHYCPRMASMNKSCFRAIVKHAPKQPALIFVSSRRQTRLTANALIGLCCLEDSPKRFLHISDSRLEMVLEHIQDPSLAHALSFGIGLHHAGLVDSDRRWVEELFVNMEIQVLVATSTLAWGVNTPAHLVVVKGTEYYETKLKQYVDFPMTDVLQMMGRAGRPGYDDKGIACVFVQDTKKSFYKEFLHAPFPVESSLHKALHDPMNAEIAAQTIQSKQDAVNYLSWTFLYLRLQQNPDYYGVEHQNVDAFLLKLIEQVFSDLQKAGCIQVEGIQVEPTVLGLIGSQYYIQYLTLQLYHQTLQPHLTSLDLLKLVSQSMEFAELPLRHNEDQYNRDLAKLVPIQVRDFDSPHTKAHLLFQAFFEQCPLPIVDYITDTQTLLDQCPRLLQAMIDICVWKEYLATACHTVALFQSLHLQGVWPPLSLDDLPSLTSSLQVQMTCSTEPTLVLHLHSSTPVIQASVVDVDHSISPSSSSSTFLTQTKPMTSSPGWYLFFHSPSHSLCFLKRTKLSSKESTASVSMKEWNASYTGTLTILCDSFQGIAHYKLEGSQVIPLSKMTPFISGEK